MKNSLKIFSTKIDLVTMDEAVEQILAWTKGKGKHYVVTTNVEFLMAARQDSEFRQILNRADLSVPDSARFGWARAMISEKSPLKRLLLWPTFFIKDCPGREPLSVVTGVDLMQELCQRSVRQGFTIGLLGGQEGVAVKTKECLEKSYPGIKITFAEAGGKVDDSGNVILGPARSADGRLNDAPVNKVRTPESDPGQARMIGTKILKQDPETSSELKVQDDKNFKIPPVDILFVAFGQVKQEKWIIKHMDQVPAKVFIGVGGAFDYLSGNVPRAPKMLQNLGLEWLFRLVIQPWRIKRFEALVKFVFLMLRNAE